jgi:hypothetical protein
MTGDPFDDPLWKEATKHANGYVRPRVGYIGFPVSWLKQVLPVVASKEQLVVALLVFRRLRYDKPVPIPNDEISELGIDRHIKYHTLVALERAGLVELERVPGRPVGVKLVGRY